MREAACDIGMVGTHQTLAHCQCLSELAFSFGVFALLCKPKAEPVADAGHLGMIARKQAPIDQQRLALTSPIP